MGFGGGALNLGEEGEGREGKARGERTKGVKRGSGLWEMTAKARRGDGDFCFGGHQATLLLLVGNCWRVRVRVRVVGSGGGGRAARLVAVGLELKQLRCGRHASEPACQVS